MTASTNQLACLHCKQPLADEAVSFIDNSNPGMGGCHLRCADAYHAKRKKKAKSKAPARPKIDPVEGANKIASGKAKANAALSHILEARRHLNAACADLCAVVGANDFWRALSRLSKLVDDEKTYLDRAINNDADPLFLDREPTEIDLLAPHRSGCGGVSGVKATKGAFLPPGQHSITHKPTKP